VNYASGKFWASEHAVVATPIIPMNTIWLGELFRAMNLNQYSVSAAQPGLAVESIRNLQIPRPPFEEQKAIAAFLENETEKIDTLNEEQRQLIELLKEKRQAVISHAVTKGLNPDAPMKPSGIDWLGEVPAHWEMRPIKSLAKVCNGSTPSRETPEYWTENGFPWLCSTAVNQENIYEATEFVTDRALAECTLPKISPPAVLVGITGQGRTRGMASTLQIEATINQHVAAIVPMNTALHVNYLRRFFDMAYDILRSDSEGGGSTKAAITCEQISNLRICLPPEREQTKIVEFLDCELERNAALINCSVRAIEFLQERRSALVSAAVHGKIDVRNAVPECVA
jgi:type I restriction enzyme S subunit